MGGALWERRVGQQVRRQVGQGRAQRLARALGRGLRRVRRLRQVHGQGALPPLLAASDPSRRLSQPSMRTPTARNMSSACCTLRAELKAWPHQRSWTHLVSFPDPCRMWVMQWAERLVEGGGNEQWGENWVEDFKDGAGSKKVGGRACSVG